ncbi:MAG: tetratricopeptide repeat protein, partial [Candidatus Thorarchaeota archaeon]
MNKRVEATNPYIAGAPLRLEKGFFGREDILDWVARELMNPQTNALVLFGQRRIGKTTLLLQLARTLPKEHFLPIYFDLQDQATRPLGEALIDMADLISEEIGIELGEAEAFDNKGRYFLREFLPQVYKAMGDERRPVFLLDEFDVLDQSAEAELADTATAKALFPLLRRLMTIDSKPAFVFVVGRRAEDLSLDFNATFKASLVREVWILDEKDARDLVRQAEANQTLRFTDEAIDRCLSLSNRHPYLTQLLCQRIWESAYAKNPSSPPLVDLPQVDAAVDNALEAGNQALDWLWSGLSPAEKIYASALAETAGEHETISEDRITQILAQHAARLRTREVELAPRDLVRRHVLDSRGDGGFSFAVELFRRWVQQNKPLHVVKDEIDRLDPIADRLFGIGVGFFNRREWEQAARYFQDALNLNPRHFRARLLMGEALLELNRVNEALVALDQAYDLDRDSARLPLARARINRGLSLEQAGEEEAALAIYESVLAISPMEVQAKDRISAIWRNRGRAAEASENIKEALEAYRKAGYKEGIERIERQLKQQSLDELEAKAQELAQVERWEETVAAYQELIEQAQDEDSRQHWQSRFNEYHQKLIEVLEGEADSYEQRGDWKNAVAVYTRLVEKEGQERFSEALERVNLEIELAEQFSKGMQSLREEEWKEAQSHFLHLVNQRPDYKRENVMAAELLLDSIKHHKRRLVWLSFTNRLTTREDLERRPKESIWARTSQWMKSLLFVTGIILGFIAIYFIDVDVLTYTYSATIILTIVTTLVWRFSERRKLQPEKYAPGQAKAGSSEDEVAIEKPKEGFRVRFRGYSRLKKLLVVIAGVIVGLALLWVLVYAGYSVY